MLLAQVVAASTPAAPFPEDYVMLLEACRDGEPPSPVLARESLAGWSGERLSQALAGIRAARAPTPADPAPDERIDAGLLAFAAVVHAELAFALRDRAQAAAKAHLDMGQGLLALLPATAETAALKARWFLGVGCRHRRDFELDEARRWLRAGLAASPEDARLLLALGSVDEWMAEYDNPICPSAGECPSSAAREQYLAIEWERQRLVTSGESLYRRALAADPALAEARLRLGRLLAQRVSRTRGTDLLRAALEQASSDEMRYLAHLFLGAALEDTECPAEAAANYRAALALCPDAQTARLALSRCLRRSADRTGDHETLLPLLAAAGAEAEAPASRDAWWVYAGGPQVCAESEWRSLSQNSGR
jgi:tetratricopeptide (TPR) repeat protein